MESAYDTPEHSKLIAPRQQLNARPMGSHRARADWLAHQPRRQATELPLLFEMRGVESGGETEPPEMIDWSEARHVKAKLISTAKQMAGRTCRRGHLQP
ncbi:unnamed protein product [Boreogadus saida]